MAENIRSTLVRPAYPSPDKVNYPDHYWVSVPIATTGSLGVAKFDGDYFTVDRNGTVSLKQSIIDAFNEAYRKPETGIPKSDLASGVQASLDAADSAYQKPGTGIPKDALASGVQDSLNAADSAYQKPGTGIPKDALASGVQSSLDAADSAYQKPGTGIPKDALASGVQDSLDAADTAYQKPGTGIPEGDLDSGVQASLAAADSAYQKPGTGIPENDLSAEVQAKLNGITPNGAYRHDIELIVTKTVDSTEHDYYLFVEIINSSSTPYTSLGINEIRMLTCKYGCDAYEDEVTDQRDGLGIILCPGSFIQREPTNPRIGFLCFKENGSSIYLNDNETYTISDIVSVL